ncbi:MAG: c-type cytochrome [Methylococcaceae bacterium]
MIRTILILGTLVSVSTTSQAGPVEDLIRQRQSAYSLAAWQLAKIKSQVVQHPEQYDRQSVTYAALGLAAIAHSDLASLHTPGSEQGSGWQKTRLKPEYFQKPDEAKTLGLAFAQEATELARIAETGDIAAIKTQFGKTSGTCKNCHDAFRLRDVDE